MKTLRHTDKGFERDLDKLLTRRSLPESAERAARRIIDEVRRDGDAAIAKFAMEIDKAKLSLKQFSVSEKELIAAAGRTSASDKKAIKTAIAHVTAFAKRQLPKKWTFSPRPGVTLGEKFTPLDRVGVYIPGGTAPLVSTVVHTVAIAKAAGVKEIVVTTPPGKDGAVCPELLCALRMAGATEVYRLGGVYGIAALAYGTKTIKKVEKIVGPGNAYVAAAKKIVYGDVAIDMVAGPSEIMIVADAGANAEFIAADMLSQAEHGSGLEQAVLVSTSDAVIDGVRAALPRRARKLSRSKAVDTVLRDGVFMILVKDLVHAAELASAYAPEHLELMCAGADRLAEKITAAGAIFVGEHTPEPVGDFTAGPSHVLPTGGSARFFGGLAVEAFFRRSSLLKYSKEALAKELPSILAFSRMEGLDAHGASAAVRFES